MRARRRYTAAMNAMSEAPAVAAVDFETALSARAEEMAAACTRCGKCVEVCPVTDAAGVAAATPSEVIGGVIDILRTGEGPAASRAWAKGCALSGDCIEACDEDVNPRFLLSMARVALAKKTVEPRDRRRAGVENYRLMADGVTVLSRMQLGDDGLARLGQKVTERLSSGSTAKPGEAPDFVFYTGCNVLKTPAIAMHALDLMDALGITYRVMGGPSHCCGVIQLRTGDAEMSGRMGANTLGKLAEGKAGVLAWCGSCHVQFTETTLPTVEKMTGARPFEMTPFMLFLSTRFDALKPMLTRPVAMRVALHVPPGVRGVARVCRDLLASVPGIEIVDIGQPSVGLMNNSLNALPDFKRSLQLATLDACERAGVDALVDLYHVDHRELCAHERDWPFRIVNIMEIVAASMGLPAYDDNFKRLKISQDADAILADCRDLLAAHGIAPEAARKAVMTAMLGEQPLPLRGG
jgi:Fe-S oxidoreductase